MSGTLVRKQHERDGGGLIATFLNMKTDVTRVEIFAGINQTRAPRKGWRGGQTGLGQAAADRCRELGDDWVIVSLNTPGSIYTDLKGRRPTSTKHVMIAMPETNMVGRRNHDILHPRLLGSSGPSVRLRVRAQNANGKGRS